MGQGETARATVGICAAAEHNSGACEPELQDLAAEFERCWPWLEAALEFGAFKHNGVTIPSHRKEHVWERILSGRSLFWPGECCAIITEIHVSPTGLRSHHNWLAGGDLDEIVAMMPDIEDYGRQQGCHQQTGSGRRGWLRAFEGYREIGIRKAKPL